MAKPSSKPQASSDEALSNSSNSSSSLEDEQVNVQLNEEEDEEELEAVARSAGSDEDNSPASDDDAVPEDGDADEEDEVITIMPSTKRVRFFASCMLDLGVACLCSLRFLVEPVTLEHFWHIECIDQAILEFNTNLIIGVVALGVDGQSKVFKY